MPVVTARFHRVFGGVIVLGALLWLAIPASASAAGAPPASPPLAAGIARQPLAINFGDFTAQAELDYPAGATGKLPVVILVPGSSPEDLNGDIASPGAPLLPHDFLSIANELVPRGVAVLRYNKHYVTSLTQVNYQAYYTKLTLQKMLSDAEQVLATAKADPHVDPRRIYVYGWSEGSTVAAALAARHSELAGLIVQGPVAESWTQTFLYQLQDVGVPYLRQFAPDGKVTVATIKAAAVGPGGLVAKGILSYVAPGFRQGNFTFSPGFDRSHTGIIDINTQLLPSLSYAVQSIMGPGRPLQFYAPHRALPTVTQQAPKLKMPVLILQGQNDANVPVAGAQQLAATLRAAGNTSVTLDIFPGLGHSLGPATSLIADNFRPIAPAPLQALASWLAAQSGVSGQTPAQLPASGTGGGSAAQGGVILLLALILTSGGAALPRVGRNRRGHGRRSAN